MAWLEILLSVGRDNYIMAYAIIDTSSILFGFSYRKDAFAIAERAFSGLEPLVSRGTLRELEKASSNRGAKGAAARVALSILKLKKIRVDTNTGNVDSWIIRKAASMPGTVVVTNDTELLMKLKSLGVRTAKLSKSGKLR